MKNFIIIHGRGGINKLETNNHKESEYYQNVGQARKRVGTFTPKPASQRNEAHMAKAQAYQLPRLEYEKTSSNWTK